MSTGFFKVPKAKNEIVKSYRPGSPERKEVIETYQKMISLIHFRRDRLIEKKAFVDQLEINKHVKIIEEEDKISNKNARMRELENWLEFINPTYI